VILALDIVLMVAHELIFIGELEENCEEAK
jgi:hypothetical protein